MKKVFCSAALIVSFLAVNDIFGQTLVCNSSTEAETTPAYALLENLELKTDKELTNLLEKYTANSSAVQSKQFELDLIKLEKTKLLSIKPDKLCRLNENYGNLILSELALKNELRNLLVKYTPRHPLVIEKLSALVAAEENVLRYLD